MPMRKEYRPFNVEQAKAGAPIGHIKDDCEVKIYEYFDNHCLGASRSPHNPIQWYANGWNYDGCQLVMLPLFHCQSKPVYMGDTLHDANGAKFEVELSHTQSMIDECTWDAPKKGVETSMTDDELDDIWEGAPIFGGRQAVYDAYRAIANAAIARAIEDGDVFTFEHMKKAFHIGSGGILGDEDIDALINNVIKEPK